MNSLNKMSSQTQVLFVCRLNGCGAQLPTTFVVSAAHRPLRLRPPEATAADQPRENPLRPNAAPLRGELRPHRGCRVPALERRRGGRHGQQGPGASEARPEIRAPTWGISTRFSRLKFMRKMFAVLAGLFCRWSTNRQIRPLSRMLQSIHSKLF